MNSTWTLESTSIQSAFDQGSGILQLAPNWVPRTFCIPGKRIKLHPADYYALGGQRGGIDERWLASATRADNGPGTPEDEGLSYCVVNGERVGTLAEAVEELGAALLGDRIWKQFGRLPMYSKFFDNQTPLPFHIHHRDEHAALTGQVGKPEAYYFPPQLNNHRGSFPYTHFGFASEITKEQVSTCLHARGQGDNRLIDLAPAYRLMPGTGWDVPPGVLHAPGSLCTYEPQAASDVYCMYQSLIDDWQVLPEELFWKDSPADRHGDVDWLIEIIDWERNVDPDFHAHRFMAPQAKCHEPAEQCGYREDWICYRSPAFSASELTVLPGRSVCISEQAAYGAIIMQGRGHLGVHQVESPALVRYGELTNDEYFISEQAAAEGVQIVNKSDRDPLVLLKCYGPGHPELATLPGA